MQNNLRIVCGIMLCGAMLHVGVQASYAEPLSISLDGDTYNHGDRFVLSITVEEVTDSTAILYIRDSNGTNSSAIPIEISEKNTVMPPSFQFERELFAEGTYYIDIIYGNLTASVSFQIIDIGNVVVPHWIKTLAFQWAVDAIAPSFYVDALKNPQMADILHVNADDSYDATSFIPEWVKEVTLWWLVTEEITDDEYVMMMQYLIDHGMIRGL